MVRVNQIILQMNVCLPEHICNVGMNANNPNAFLSLLLTTQLNKLKLSTVGFDKYF